MISVVIPFYNEILCIKPLLERTHATLKKCGFHDYEILVVNNGSEIVQSEELKRHCAADARVRIVSLSRNFGYQGALWAGLDHAHGNAIVFMDGDGEDPPEVIEKFIAEWKKGFDVVYGVRTSRKRSWMMRSCYHMFYRMLARWSNVHIPVDAGEFSLISGKALTALKQIQDRTRMMRILRAWVGFKQTGVEYAREQRIHGVSKFSMLSTFRFAWDGFVAATDVPVRLAVFSAISCFVLGALGSLYYVCWYFFGKQKIPGFASLNITILFLFSVLFVCFAVLARYVITLLDETRKRPPYLVMEETNSSADESHLKKVANFDIKR